jgi:hypothetical protein
MTVPVRSEELLIALVAKLIGTVRHVAVGAASPIPAAAALLAATRTPSMRVSLLSSRRHNFFTDGGRELFDCAGQGRVDVFFLSGGQIDGHGNVNLVALGDYANPTTRFPGSLRLGLSLFRRPARHPVPARTQPAHLGRAGRFHLGTGYQPAGHLPPGRAGGAGDRIVPLRF